MINLPFNIDLSEQTAIITGANNIICATMAKALAKCGAKVAMIDFSIENAQRFADQINDAGFNAKAYKVNIIDKQDVESAYNEIKRDFGNCDILINGAGGNNPKATTSFEFYTDGDIDRDISSFFNLDIKSSEFVFNLNFLSTLIPCQVFSKDMVKKHNGAIVNISSMNSFIPFTKIPVYSAAKAGLNNFTQWLAVYFSKVGVRVNAIATGFFMTKQNQSLLIGKNGKFTPKATKIISNTPMGRFGIEEELIATLFYLVCMQASSYVTGIVIPVDGGFSAYSGI